MVPFRSTLRTAYLESKTLTPVAQPKDQARVRFKRLFLAPALRECTQKFSEQFRRQSPYNRRSQIHSYWINTDEIAKPAVDDSTELSRSKLHQKLLSTLPRLNQQSWESISRQRQLNAIAHSGKSKGLKSSKLKYKEQRFLPALKDWVSALSIR